MTREEEDKILAFIEANRPKLVASIREYFKDRLLADPRAETNHWDLVADWRQWVAQQKADMDAALEVAEYNHNFANLFPEATGVNRLGTYNARRSFPVRILYTEEEQSRQQITLFLEAVMDPEIPWCLSYLDYLAWVKAELPSGTVALDKEAFQKTVAYFQSKQETSKMRQSHKLTEDQVAAIVAEAKMEPYQRIADRYGINKTTVGYHVRKAAGKITPKSRTFTPSATPATAPPAPSPVVLKGVLKGLPAGGAK